MVHRKASGTRAVQIWNVASPEASCVAEFRPRSFDAPHLSWSSDEELACRVATAGDALHLYHGSISTSALASGVEPVPIAGVSFPNVKQTWLSPAAGPYCEGDRDLEQLSGASLCADLLAFAGRTKSKPGSVSIWRYRKGDASAVSVASKSLQSDECRVEWSPDGQACLVQLSTSSSADSY